MGEKLEQRLREELKSYLEDLVFDHNLQDEQFLYFSNLLDTFAVVLITTDTKGNVTDGWIRPLGYVDHVLGYAEQVHFSINGDGSVWL